MNEKEQEAAKVEARIRARRVAADDVQLDVCSAAAMASDIGFDAGIQHSRLPADGWVSVEDRLPDDLLAEARECIAHAMGTTPAAKVLDELEGLTSSVASFARTAIASAVKAERERIADDIEHLPEDAIREYAERLRGENNGQ